MGCPLPLALHDGTGGRRTKISRVASSQTTVPITTSRPGASHASCRTTRPLPMHKPQLRSSMRRPQLPPKGNVRGPGRVHLARVPPRTVALTLFHRPSTSAPPRSSVPLSSSRVRGRACFCPRASFLPAPTPTRTRPCPCPCLSPILALSLAVPVSVPYHHLPSRAPCPCDGAHESRATRCRRPSHPDPHPDPTHHHPPASSCSRHHTITHAPQPPRHVACGR
mmetsp:Transcript_13749/g.40162  ORF Transcript_13749/g.40162 Transcript_13749/m.40162 type:complete len:223 (+) Transcript_13749:2450-3118(+)